MSIKSMKRDDWSRVVKKKVIIQDFEYCGLKGKASLLEILEVTSALIIDYGSRKVKLADAGYSWLQIALEGQLFWLTAMFDENEHLVEIYIDMTDGNVTDADDPYFTDMYLDYAVFNDDAVLVLDMDELDEARESGAISLEQYERTLSEGQKVYEYITANRQAVQKLVRQKYCELKAVIQ